MTDVTAFQARPADLRAALLEPLSASPQWLKSSLSAVSADFRPMIPEASALTEIQRRTVTEMCSRLEAHLRPASDDDLGVGFAMLQAAFPAANLAEGEARANARAYMIALDGVPSFALAEAVRLILRGEAGLDRRFMATPPELRALVDRLTLPARAHRVQLRRLLEAQVERAVPAGPRELPPEVQEFLRSVQPRRRGPGNPAGVDHSAPYRPG
ncbi:hypothetical protein V5F44_20260 [Xanthobacter sp. V2C-8]|uniref:hypothetical protein n=1 Tax=Xanthobacter albus TaxID=3119929 RepID=UPI003727FEC6